MRPCASGPPLWLQAFPIARKRPSWKKSAMAWRSARTTQGAFARSSSFVPSRCQVLISPPDVCDATQSGTADGGRGMSSDALHKRERALEEEFFAKKNHQLRDKLKATFDQDVTREKLKAATGITNPVVLERLIALQVRGETMAAFWLYPLVEVAWADGKLDRKERDAILEAAGAGGGGRRVRHRKGLGGRAADPRRNRQRLPRLTPCAIARSTISGTTTRGTFLKQQ